MGGVQYFVFLQKVQQKNFTHAEGGSIFLHFSKNAITFHPGGSSITPKFNENNFTYGGPCFSKNAQKHFSTIRWFQFFVFFHKCKTKCSPIREFQFFVSQISEFPLSEVFCRHNKELPLIQEKRQQKVLYLLYFCLFSTHLCWGKGVWLHLGPDMPKLSQRVGLPCSFLLKNK